MHEADVVLLDHELAESLLTVELRIMFDRLVESQIHEFVHSNDFSSDSSLQVLIKPNFHQRLCLQEFECQHDRSGQLLFLPESVVHLIL